MGDVIAGAPADSVRMSTSAALSIDTQPVRALPSRSAMGALVRVIAGVLVLRSG